jgi:hypothetical protein
VGFIGQLVRNATTRAIDIALERVFPVDLVQSSRLGSSSSGHKNENLASARTLRGCDDLEAQTVSTSYYEQRAKEIVEAQKSASAVQPQPEEKRSEAVTGKVIKLPPRPLDGSFKLEQNLGCELPVCVANKQDVNEIAIEVTTDDGVLWRLIRTADSKLPAPGHYRYWLWYLDRLQAASERGETEAPVIVLDPVELFDLFGGPRGGSMYSAFDDAFVRYSKLVIERGAAYRLPDGRMASDTARLGTLCMYRSLQAKPEKKNQLAFDFVKGGIVPGPVLWQSVKANYLKSIPLAPIRQLDYVGLRLYTYLHKHCRPGGEFEIAARKLLPKIPMAFVADQTKRRLRPHHEQLQELGFLEDVAFEGKSETLKLIYRRS